MLFPVIDKNHTGPAVDFKYHQDVLSGERLQVEVRLNLQNLNTSAQGFDKLANDLVSRKRDKDMMQYITQEFEAIVKPLQEQLKAGDLNEIEFGKIVMEKYAEFIAVMTVQYPDDFSGLPEESLKKSNYFHSRIYDDYRAEFEKYYQPLLNKQIKIEDDPRIWELKRLHFVLAPSRDGKKRSTVYCHFTTKTGHEKEILCFEVFRAFKLTYPDLAPWL